MTASRLDRLVTLLETGSTQLIRHTAAQQLADVQKNHPDELFNLLTRVVPYLRSLSWDTRTAAARAIGGIVEHADKYDPNAILDPDDAYARIPEGQPVKAETGTPALPSEQQLQLATLDVEAILTTERSSSAVLESSMTSSSPASTQLNGSRIKRRL